MARRRAKMIGGVYGRRTPLSSDCRECDSRDNHGNFAAVAVYSFTYGLPQQSRQPRNHDSRGNLTAAVVRTNIVPIITL
ncbi:MAG: hypothetical protein GY820_02640 [Gammaproteobacteria bacterium]|nr:hypothetical protein [Gammaproteobacteria bacterium]